MFTNLTFINFHYFIFVFRYIYKSIRIKNFCLMDGENSVSLNLSIIYILLIKEYLKDLVQLKLPSNIFI